MNKHEAQMAGEGLLSKMRGKGWELHVERNMFIGWQCWVQKGSMTVNPVFCLCSSTQYKEYVSPPVYVARFKINNQEILGPEESSEIHPKLITHIKHEDPNEVVRAKLHAALIYVEQIEQAIQEVMNNDN